MLEKFFSDLSIGNVTYIEQVTNGNEFICRKRTESDGEIKPEMSVSQVINLSRALVHPWPGVYYYDINDNKVIIDRVLDLRECRRILKEIKEKNEDRSICL